MSNPLGDIEFLARSSHRVGVLEELVVSYPGPRYPYEPIERLSHLIEETSASGASTASCTSRSTTR